jgi:hypothetical protein
MTMAATYIIGKHGTWYQHWGWSLVGLIVLVIIIVGFYFLIRGIYRAGKKGGGGTPNTQASRHNRS